MLKVWFICILFAVVTAAALNIPTQFVKINGESMPKTAFIPHFKLKPRIANGDRAELGSFPWHVSLAIKYRSSPDADPTFCSGAILNEKWILTPAQCIQGAHGIRVDVGSIDINKPLLSVYPDAFTLHPQYDNSNQKYKNNIGLVRLPEKSKFDFDKSEGKYGPIRLPKRSQVDNTFEGIESYFSGFGYPSFHSTNVSERLLFAEQYVIPNTACAAYYGNDFELISDDVICAMSAHFRQGACTSDAGGPLVINEFGTYTLVGLLSFIHEKGSCGRQAIPAAFTRITKHFDWIGKVSGYQFRA